MSTTSTPAPEDTSTTPLKRIRRDRGSNTSGPHRHMEPKKFDPFKPEPPAVERVYFHGWLIADPERNDAFHAELTDLLKRYKRPGDTGSISAEFGPAPEPLG